MTHKKSINVKVTTTIINATVIKQKHAKVITTTAQLAKRNAIKLKHVKNNATKQLAKRNAIKQLVKNNATKQLAKRNAIKLKLAKRNAKHNQKLNVKVTTTALATINTRLQNKIKVA